MSEGSGSTGAASERRRIRRARFGERGHQTRMTNTFTKLQAVGNDFLIIATEDVAELRNARELAQKLCNRNYGAGADGLVFVTRSRHPNADFATRIFNADGGEAEVSGN